MELFTRGLMGPVRNAQKAWEVRAREISELPNLSKDERALFSSFDFAGTQLTAEFLGGMSTQWAAHRLIEAAHQSGEEVSESFALTVLQQGAAVGLGKFFHGKLEAWKKHRDALAKTRLGKLPEMKSLFAAREAFRGEGEARGVDEHAAGHAAVFRRVGAGCGGRLGGGGARRRGQGQDGAGIAGRGQSR